MFAIVKDMQISKVFACLWVNKKPNRERFGPAIDINRLAILIKYYWQV